MKFIFKVPTTLGLSLLALVSQAQLGGTNSLVGGDPVNTITTAVPFMTISPDARHGALGDAGVASSPDINAMHWNAAKLAFVEDRLSFGISYTPWLRNLVPDIALANISGYYQIDKFSTFGAAFRYFSLGDIQFTDEFGNETQQHSPNEWSLDAAYSRKLSDRFSGGITLRFIYSNLTGSVQVNNTDTKPGLAIASDIAVYYQNDDVELGNTDATFAWGAVISNIGNKMSYSDANEQDFLPMNLRFGPRLTLHLDEYNDVTFLFDVNKLLVPTPPIYDTEPGAQDEIVAGDDPDRSVANAMFTSFFDAPGTPVRDAAGEFIRNDDGTIQTESGSAFREELREFYFGVGAEYWYNKIFAARVGYFAEHATKGNRKHLTFGVGLKYNVFGLDFSYLIPFYVGNQRSIQNSPLQNTLRFTLSFNFAELKTKDGAQQPVEN